MSTPRERTLPLWRLRLARWLLGLVPGEQYRAELHGHHLTEWGKDSNPHDVTLFIQYTHGKDVKPRV